MLKPLFSHIPKRTSTALATAGFASSQDSTTDSSSWMTAFSPIATITEMCAGRRSGCHSRLWGQQSRNAPPWPSSRSTNQRQLGPWRFTGQSRHETTILFGIWCILDKHIPRKANGAKPTSDREIEIRGSVFNSMQRYQLGLNG